MSTDNNQTTPASIGWPPVAKSSNNPALPTHFPGWVIPGHEPEPQRDDPSLIRNPKH